MARLKEETLAVGIALCALMVLSIPALWWMARTLSYDEAPIVTDMEISEWYVKNGNAHARVVGMAGRRCGPPLSWSAESDGHVFTFRFLDDKDPDGGFIPPDEAPPGRQSFGLWKFDGIPTGNDIIIRVFHDCDGEIVQTIWSMTIPKPIDQ